MTHTDSDIADAILNGYGHNDLGVFRMNNPIKGNSTSFDKILKGSVVVVREKHEFGIANRGVFVLKKEIPDVKEIPVDGSDKEKAAFVKKLLENGYFDEDEKKCVLTITFDSMCGAATIETMNNILERI